MSIIKAKKSLGQHFLTAPGIVREMVTASQTAPADTVIEIGPGKGVLTRELLSFGASVIALEKDDRLIPVLHKTFQKEIAEQKLTLVHADALSADISKLAGKPYRVVANIPYYITGQIIRRLLQAESQPMSITMLVQKEVAERIAATDKKESLLSLSVKAFGSARYVRSVGRGAFSPAPAVDSAIIHISDISRKNFESTDEALFFKILHAGFAHKRKQLLPNLANVFERKSVEEAFAKAGLAMTARAENIPIEGWLNLTDYLAG